MAVSLARLVADSDLVRDMLHMCECEVPEKHISLQGVDIEMISMYAKLLSSGEMETGYHYSSPTVILSGYGGSSGKMLCLLHR